VHRRAAVDGEGVCTYEHAHMAPPAGVGTRRAEPPSRSCRTFVAVLHQTWGAMALGSRVDAHETADPRQRG
jgi:hypothetical protein